MGHKFDCVVIVPYQLEYYSVLHLSMLFSADEYVFFAQ